MARRLVFFLFCLTVISACGVKKTEVTESPEAARARQKASQRPYTVNGQRYEPLQTHKGFVQSGIASWYGQDFQGKMTSNGEKYDMNAMTAAHKTLPLGVYIRVKNADNGRETVVRVNDRGPFVKGRILDLSYAAAKTLGVDVAGTAWVKVEALGYRVSGTNTYKAAPSYETGSYTVQIGSFRDPTNAERLSGEMKKLFGFSEIHMTTVNNATFYRVYAGKYLSLKDAENAEREFCDHGYPGSFAVALE